VNSAVLFSGGVDSTAAMLAAIEFGCRPVLVHVDYGQRNRAAEHDAVLAIAKAVGLGIHTIHMGSIACDVWGLEQRDTNPLFSRDVALPEDSVPIIPGRNLLFIALGAAFCQSRGISRLYTGLHHTTSSVRDSSAQFHNACAKACGAYNVDLMSPFLAWRKEEIVRHVKKSGLYDLTWSCYEGGEEPCGRCAACRARGDYDETGNA
jgi:7-cyano-7-deazaguanine synthase